MDQETKSISQWNNKHVIFQWSLQSNWNCYWFWKIVSLRYHYFSKRSCWFCLNFPLLENIATPICDKIYYRVGQICVDTIEDKCYWKVRLLWEKWSIIKWSNHHFTVSQVLKKEWWLDTGRKQIIHKTYKKHLRRLLYILCTFLCPLYSGLRVLCPMPCIQVTSRFNKWEICH